MPPTSSLVLNSNRNRNPTTLAIKKGLKCRPLQNLKGNLSVQNISDKKPVIQIWDKKRKDKKKKNMKK